jgi:ribosome maturation protein SDO1
MSGPTGNSRIALTNVAVVRLKKAGKKFEVAAYKNKIISWRTRAETDINEVLQIVRVFSNVSKGAVANSKDLIEAFGTDDAEKVSLLILDKGEFEISDKERHVLFESLFRDVAAVVSEKCVNPETKRPYTVSLIEKALRDIHFSVNPQKNTKQQALKAISLLEAANFPIQRAKMRLLLSITDSQFASLKSLLLDKMGASMYDEMHNSVTGIASVEALIDPGHFREVEEFMNAPGRTMEVMSLSASANDEGQEERSNAHTNEASARDEDKGISKVSSSMEKLSVNAPSVPGDAVFSDATAASSRGTGMMVRRIVQPTMNRFSCNACASSFESSEAHRAHHRTDWHRYNLKLRAKGGEFHPRSSDEFELLSEKEKRAVIDAD